jgi:hypothetical protein
MRHSVSTILALILLAGALLPASPVLAGKGGGNYHVSFSGSSVRGGGDVDGDGLVGSVAFARLRGSLGASDSQSVNELGPFAGDLCGPAVIRQDYIYSTAVRVFPDGDVLTSELDASIPSFLCFDVVERTFTFEIHRVVTGGSGRFENATGRLVATGSGRQLGADATGSVQSVFTGEQTGVVNR